MRSMASGGAVHRAYTNAIQQAILEAHELAFAYFGGVFATLRDDNLGLAVKKILRGYQRHETERMLGFRSHWGFQSKYCNPAHGNEKGGVENELGWFRRNWLAPVPEAADLMAFNRQLLDWCMATAVRVITGRATSVGVAMGEERPQLLPLADLGFDRSEILFPGIVVGTGSGRGRDGVGTGSGRGRDGVGTGSGRGRDGVGTGSGRGREGVRARQGQPLFATAWAGYWGVHTGASA